MKKIAFNLKRLAARLLDGLSPKPSVAPLEPAHIARVSKRASYVAMFFYGFNALIVPVAGPLLALQSSVAHAVLAPEDYPAGYVKIGEDSARLTVEASTLTGPAVSDVQVSDSDGNGKPEASGTTEPGSTVTITWPDGSSSTTTAGSDGSFSVEAPSSQPSGNVNVAATSPDGNTGPSTNVSYNDSTAPDAPSLSVADANGDGKPEVTGTAEPGSTVTITWPDGTSSSVTADGNGDFSAEAPTVQGSGTISATATDAANNRSPSTEINYTDTTAPLAPSVSVTDITGVLQIGQTLTGVYSFDANGGEPTDASELLWKNGGRSEITLTYLLNASDVGQVLTFEVRAKNGAGVTGNTAAISTATAPGVSGGDGSGGAFDPARPPVVDVTDITGLLQIGQTLTGVYIFNAYGGDPTDASTLLWKDGGHSATTLNYLLDARDVGQVLTFEVIAKNGLGVTGNTTSISTIFAPGVSGGDGSGGVIDPNQPSATHSALAAAPAQIVADGSAAAVITFTARNEANQPIADLSVTFDVTGVTGTSVGSVTESASGVYTATLSGTNAGVATIGTTVNGLPFAVMAASVTLTADSGTAGLINPGAGLQVLGNNSLADGVSTNSVKATVADAYGNLLSGVVVSFVASNGAVITSTGITGSDGSVIVTLSNMTSAGTILTATVNGASADAVVTFIPVLTTAVPAKTFTASASASYSPVAVNSAVGENLVWTVIPALPSGLSLNSASGQITGTPSTSALTTTYTMSVKDGEAGAANTATFSLGVAGAITFTQAIYSTVLSLNGSVSLSPFAVAGGVNPFFTIEPALPDGLVFSSDTGGISGAPLVNSASTTYTVRVTDDNGASVLHRDITLSVVDGPALTVNVPSKVLTSGTSAGSYSPVSGTSPVAGALTYSVTPALPAGLGLNSTNGQITGTPTTVTSAAAYTMIVSDGKSGASSSEEFSLAIADAITFTQTIYSTVLSLNGSVNLSPFTVAGGVNPSFTIESVLPAGLVFNSGTGGISGTPLVNSASTTYTVRVTDDNAASVLPRDITLSVVDGPALTVNVPSKVLTSGTSAGSYSPVSGTSPVGGALTYSVTPALPAGLGLNSTNGQITGTPTTVTSAAAYTMIVFDGKSGASNTTTFSLGVADAITFTQTIYLRVLSLNSSVSLSPFAVAGGVNPSFTIEPALPAGLVFNSSTGGISGTPLVDSASATYTVRVADDNGESVLPKNITLSVVDGPALTVNVPSKVLTNGTSAGSYTPVSGVSPVGGALTYSVTPALPAGLGLNSTNGQITGTPTTVMSMTTYTMTVKDGVSGATDFVTFDIAVLTPISYSQKTYSKTLVTGISSSFTLLEVSGGSGSYSHVVSPELPGGLAITQSSGVFTVSGTPVAPHVSTSYTVTIQDFDAGVTFARTLTLTIN